MRPPQAALYVRTTTNGVVSRTLPGDDIRAETNLALKLLPKTEPDVSGLAWNDGGVISEDAWRIAAMSTPCTCSLAVYDAS